MTETQLPNIFLSELYITVEKSTSSEKKASFLLLTCNLQILLFILLGLGPNQTLQILSTLVTLLLPICLANLSSCSFGMSSHMNAQKSQIASDMMPNNFFENRESLF